MGLRDRLFGKHAADGQPPAYHLGMTVRCQRCKKDIVIKDPLPDPGGKVVFGAPEGIHDTALRCGDCAFITCWGCATRKQGVSVCPGCKKMFGPVLFVDWLKANPGGPQAADA